MADKSESLYIDLFIQDRDLVLDLGGIPKRCDNRLSIAQDLKHAILESSILTEMLAERSPILQQDLLLKLILLIEDDVRIIPGTVKIYFNKGKMRITAESKDFGILPQQEVDSGF